jgi:hypothetical protein
MSNPTITEFLEARIDEDEARASSGWSSFGVSRWETDNYGRDFLTPSAVRAECAAKRAIIELAEQSSEVEQEFDDYEWQGTVNRSEPLVGDAILFALAAVYKDHPGYRQDWAL